ncbi:MAG: hypothetical protein ACXVRK_10755 [Gaiellaceae bacterium]
MRGSALLVAFLLALVVADDRSQAGPESRRDGRIVVTVGESGDVGPTPRLVVMDAEGRNARVRLGWVFGASFSPDGRLIAFDQVGVRRPEIWSAAVDGRGRGRRLVRDGRDVDWSPLGGAIAFVRYPHSGSDEGEIWVENLQTRAQRRVGHGASVFALDWTPDGKKLAFGREGDVWVVDVASKRAHRLIVDAGEPRWSPDGNRIAFLREVDGESFVFVARADGSAPRRLAAGDTAAWSPDGTELAIGDFRRITRIRLDGTHRRVIYAPKGGCPACRDLDWVR